MQDKMILNPPTLMVNKMTLPDALLLRAQWWLDETGELPFPVYGMAEGLDNLNKRYGVFEVSDIEQWGTDFSHDYETRSYFDLLIREAIK